MESSTNYIFKDSSVNILISRHITNYYRSLDRSVGRSDNHSLGWDKITSHSITDDDQTGSAPSPIITSQSSGVSSEATTDSDGMEKETGTTDSSVTDTVTYTYTFGSTEPTEGPKGENMLF